MKRLSRLIKPLALLSYASAVTYRSFSYFSGIFQKNAHGMSKRALTDLQRHFPDFNTTSKVGTAVLEQTVKPRNFFEVEYILKFCNEHQFQLNLESEAKENQLILDTSLLKQIKKLDLDSKICSVESGVTLLELNQELQMHGLYFPFVSRFTLNAQLDTAVYSEFKSLLSLRYHSINDNIKTISAVTGSGKTLQTERSLQEGMGLNLKNLFIGSRGVLGVIGQLELAAEEKPAAFLKLEGKFKHPLRDSIHSICKNAKDYEGCHICLGQSPPRLIAIKGLRDTKSQQIQSQLQQYLEEESIVKSQTNSFEELVKSVDLPLLNQNDSVSILIPQSAVASLIQLIQGKDYYLIVRRDCIQIEFQFTHERKEEFDILTSRAIQVGGTVRGRPATLKQIDSQLVQRVVGVTNYEHKHSLKLLFDPKNLLQTDEIFGQSPSLRERISRKHKINKYILEQWLKI